MIKPEQTVEVLVRHEEFHTLEEFVEGIPQNWWSEDTRDKELILVVNVQGSCSTRVNTHKICVRHCLSSKTLHLDSQLSSSSKRGQPASSHPSEVRQPNNSS